MFLRCSCYYLFAFSSLLLLAKIKFLNNYRINEIKVDCALIKKRKHDNSFLYFYVVVLEMSWSYKSKNRCNLYSNQILTLPSHRHFKLFMVVMQRHDALCPCPSSPAKSPVNFFVERQFTDCGM